MGICSATSVLLLCYAFACLLFPISSSPISDMVCHFVNCGQGNCTESTDTFLPFDCSCNDGWKKMQMGAFILPPCVVPNCDLDLGCGSPSYSPMDIPPLTTFNITNPCSYSFCGDGTCLADDETSYQCLCNIGSTNMIGVARLPCIRQCALQQDCQALRTSIFQSPPPLLSITVPGTPSYTPPSYTPPSYTSTVPITPFHTPPSYTSQCGEKCTTVEYNFSKKNQAPGLILLIFIFILQV